MLLLTVGIGVALRCFTLALTAPWAGLAVDVVPDDLDGVPVGA